MGIGCRAACSLDTLLSLFRQMEQRLETPSGPLSAIACWAPRQHHAALTTFAHTLNVPLEAWSTTALATYAPDLSHRSASLYERTGLWGIAEAAALASAQVRSAQPPQLWITRCISSTHDATGAIARY